jgi:8-oxo-dGTP diphosphatase
VHEELGLEVAIKAPLTPVTHSYASFTVTLYPFICAIIAGEPVLREHAALAWLPPDALHSLDWAEADAPIIAEYLRFLTAPQ